MASLDNVNTAFVLWGRNWNFVCNLYTFFEEFREGRLEDLIAN